MRVGVVQFAPVFGAVARNIAKVVSLVRGQDADIWVLPELFATGYQIRDRAETQALAEEVQGPTLTTMAEKAAQFGCWFCGGFPERDGDRLYNSAFLVGPCGDVYIYRKIHLFGHEKACFDPGDLGFGVVPVNGTMVGLMICFDWVFPESARTLSLRGAQVILHPSNLVLPHCPEAMKTRAIENRVCTVTANRVGTESRIPGQQLTYIGQSVIYGSRGDKLLHLGSAEEAVGVATLDVAAACDKRVTPTNDLFLDRRPDLYQTE